MYKNNLNMHQSIFKYGPPVEINTLSAPSRNVVFRKAPEQSQESQQNPQKSLCPTQQKQNLQSHPKHACARLPWHMAINFTQQGN